MSFSFFFYYIFLFYLSSSSCTLNWETITGLFWSYQVLLLICLCLNFLYYIYNNRWARMGSARRKAITSAVFNVEVWNPKFLQTLCNMYCYIIRYTIHIKFYTATKVRQNKNIWSCLKTSKHFSWKIVYNSRRLLTHLNEIKHRTYNICQINNLLSRRCV